MASLGFGLRRVSLNPVGRRCFSTKGFSPIDEILQATTRGGMTGHHHARLGDPNWRPWWEELDESENESNGDQRAPSSRQYQEEPRLSAEEIQQRFQQFIDQQAQLQTGSHYQPGAPSSPSFPSSAPYHQRHPLPETTPFNFPRGTSPTQQGQVFEEELSTSLSSPSPQPQTVIHHHHYYNGPSPTSPPSPPPNQSSTSPSLSPSSHSEATVALLEQRVNKLEDLLQQTRLQLQLLRRQLEEED
jgi:hypothetical protein